MNGSHGVVAAGHWYASAIFQGLVLIILTLLLLVAALIPLLTQFFLSKRWLGYEIRAATPLLLTPAKVSKGLRVSYDDTALASPFFTEFRLVNRCHKDIPSSAFDQEMPIRLDLGIKIVKLLQVTIVPNQLPVPMVKTEGSAIEVGPSLIRKNLELYISVLADGPEISLTCLNPLIDIKIRQLQQSDNTSRYGINVKTVLGWLAIAFVVWWIIEQPDGAAHVVHNIGTFLSSAAHGLSKFFTSI